MKVSRVDSSKTVSSAKKAKKSSGTGGLFAERLREAAGTAEAHEVTEPTSIGAVDSVIVVQEAPDSTEQRSRGLSMTYGQGVLDRLEDIRCDLLLGTVPKERLASLAQTMRAQRRQSKDARLNEIIDEIELRAEVEIAKLTRKE